MSEVKTYAVNCNDAWLNTDGDDISGSYVKYADYMTLATKLDLAERACASLVAENAGLKHLMAVTLEHVSVTDAGQAGVAAMIINDALHHSETPATDAFLSEVRAQGVDSAINRVIAMMNHQHPVTSKAVDIMRVHAYQLRKGGWQK